MPHAARRYARSNAEPLLLARRRVLDALREDALDAEHATPRATSLDDECFLALRNAATDERPQCVVIEVGVHGRANQLETEPFGHVARKHRARLRRHHHL